jgi:membrane protease YdiL (CAAX protease family)
MSEPSEHQHGSWTPILWYLAVAYLITWCIGWAIALNYLGPDWHWAGALGPAIAALLVAWKFGQLPTLVSRIKRRPAVAGVWMGLSPLLIGGVIFLALTLFRTMPAYRYESFALTILPQLTYPLFEEIGWRGFLLPRLQSRYNPTIATLILTVFWAAWHLPMFFYRFEFTPFLVFGFVFSIFCGSILLTGTLNLARGSVPAAMLFHAANNLVSITKDATMLSIYSTILSMAALVIIAITRTRLFYKMGYAAADHKASRSIFTDG